MPIHMDAARDQQRNHRSDCSAQECTDIQRIAEAQPSPQNQSDHRADERKEAHTILSVIIRPFHLRHWNARIGGKGDDKGTNHTHGNSPFTAIGME